MVSFRRAVVYASVVIVCVVWMATSHPSDDSAPTLTPHTMMVLPPTAPPRPDGCHESLPTLFVLRDHIGARAVTMAKQEVTSATLCGPLGPMDGHCLEEELHAAIDAHPCRVPDIQSADIVWVASYFVASYVRAGRQAYRDHFANWMKILRLSNHFKTHNRSYFMYLPNWRRPPLHGVTQKKWRKDKQQYTWPFQFLSIVSHAVGMGAEAIHPCIVRCNQAILNVPKLLISNGYYEMCIRDICPNVRQMLHVPRDFAKRQQRHIAIPHAERRCLDARPLDGTQRTIFLHMSGRATVMGRRYIQKAFEETPYVERDGSRFPARDVVRDVVWGNASDALRDMCRAVFCVETQGDSLNTRRITDAVLCGCIPVLACDACVYPYEATVGLATFTVRVPDARLSSIVAIVANITDRQIKTLQNKLAEVRPMFVSPGMSPSCGKSGMVDAILKEARERLGDSALTEGDDGLPIN